MKKLVSMLLLLLLVTVTATGALAQQIIEVPPVSDISPYPTFSEVIWTNMLRASGFAYVNASASITKVSSTSVRVSATGVVNQVASDVGGTMVVQQYSGGQWNNYTTISFRRYDTDEHSITSTKTVPTNYYYRNATFHNSESYTLEFISKTVYSSGIPIT